MCVYVVHQKKYVCKILAQEVFHPPTPLLYIHSSHCFLLCLAGSIQLLSLTRTAIHCLSKTRTASNFFPAQVP